MPRPTPDEHAPYHENYLSQIPESDILSALRNDRVELLALLHDVSDDVALVHHAPYTWSIKQVLGHINDAERIFAYRALRIARGDSTPLPGFDENQYAITGEFDQISIANLVREFDLIRGSSIALFEQLPESAWKNRGIVNNHELTVNALAFILAGHVRHHLKILTRRLSPA
jgi:hypothetical protein